MRLDSEVGKAQETPVVTDGCDEIISSEALILPHPLPGRRCRFASELLAGVRMLG